MAVGVWPHVLPGTCIQEHNKNNADVFALRWEIKRLRAVVLNAAIPALYAEEIGSAFSSISH